MPLDEYHRRRKFNSTPEPRGAKETRGIAEQSQASIVVAGTGNTRNKNRDRAAASGTAAKVKLPSGAIPAEMPEVISQPALATLSDRIFSDPAWLFEIKWDGVRTLARVKNNQVALWARSQREITSEYPELAQLGKNVAGHDVWLDGEIVALDGTGRSDFQLLQRRMSIRKPGAALMQKVPVSYYVFDILYCDGFDLRPAPLLQRKSFLREILRTDSMIRYSDHQLEKGKELFDLASSQRLEGIVGKQVESSYPKGRTTSWLKFKLDLELDAVVGGWTDPRGSREHFGALLLGLYEGKALQYIGSVGTGFAGDLQTQIISQLKKVQMSECPFDARPITREKSYWTRPQIVARVRYGNVTEARHLRAPRFAGLREDIDPRECTFSTQMKTMQEGKPVHDQAPVEIVRGEMPRSTRSFKTGSASLPAFSGGSPNGRATAPKIQRHSTISSDARITEELERGSREDAFVEIEGRSLHFTHLSKIYFPKEGYTKRNILAYYYRIGPLLLPFLKDRPLVLRRYPNGIEGESFFQKDAGRGTPKWMKTVPIRSEAKSRSIRYFLANDLASLLYLVNFGCIDQNPWSSRYDDVEHPDYMFFDLDPTEGTSFATVLKLAKSLGAQLQKIGLDFFCKTSGATGFHIFIPLERIYSYEQVRQFVQTVSWLVARDNPKLITSERTVRKRPAGAIYIDAHQNSEAQSLASVYSVRAFPGAPVSTPVLLKELAATTRAGNWNLRTILPRIDKVGDLWRDFWKKRQRLEAAVNRLEKLM